MTQDKIEDYKGCVIQHGHHNDRIYLMQTPSSPSSELSHGLIRMAEKNKYSKIFAKVPESIADSFFTAGFLEESRIPDFLSGKEAALFMGYYIGSERMKEPDIDRMDEILNIALGKKESDKKLRLKSRFILRKCNEMDVSAMAKIYQKVFSSYPFPIHNPDYLLKTIQENINYFGIEEEGRLIALSSAEVDKEAGNVEMTDFATLPECRGENFGLHLLARMDREMKNKKIKTAYTIARAMSPGMNVTFRKAGYKVAGRLKNNTNISGQIESMNVWYKSLN